jgi:hypothetical protein
MKQRTRRSAEIALIEFLRPDFYWGEPYSIEMAFQALRWLIDSASDDKYVETHQWHQTCVVGLMRGDGAVNGACRPVKGVADVLHRIRMAVLANPKYRPEVARWRKDKGIHPEAVIPMRFRHYKPGSPPLHLPWRTEEEIRQCLIELLEDSAGKRLNTSLNSVHPDAKTIHGVALVVGAEGFYFSLLYGFLDIRSGEPDSQWKHPLARTEGDEPFLDTLARAWAAFEQLILNEENTAGEAP